MLTGAGNVISGNTVAGIWLRDATNNVVQGNYIGTDATGTKGIPNDPTGSTFDGIDLVDGASNNVIGGASTRRPRHPFRPREPDLR